MQVTWCITCLWNLWVTLFPTTGNQLWPFKQLYVTNSVPAGQSVFKLFRLEHINLVWRYFVVLSAMSLGSLMKSRSCCIRKSLNSAEDIQTAVCDYACSETLIYFHWWYAMEFGQIRIILTNKNFFLIYHFVIMNNNVAKSEWKETI